MTKLSINAPVAEAQAAAERFARLAGELATSENNRKAALAATNAVADTFARDLAEQLEPLRAQLEAWFRRNGRELTGDRKKSAELGGCSLGLRATKAKVVFADGDDKAAVKTVLAGEPWAKKALLAPSWSLDRAGVAKALEGKRGDEVRALGFALEAGGDKFFIDRL